MEERLDPSRFFRISRSAIVHLEAIREVLPYGGGAGELELVTGARMEVSRRRFKALMDRLSGS